MLMIRSRWRARLSSRFCLEKWEMAAVRMWGILLWQIRWATLAARMCCLKDGKNVELELVACITWITIRKPPNGSVLIIGKCGWTWYLLQGITLSWNVLKDYDEHSTVLLWEKLVLRFHVFSLLNFGENPHFLRHFSIFSFLGFWKIDLFKKSVQSKFFYTMLFFAK